MCRKFMRLFHIFALDKHLDEFLVVFFAADPPVLQLYDQGRILYDLPDDFIGNVQHFLAFAWVLVRGDKPVPQALPLSVDIFPYGVLP